MASTYRMVAYGSQGDAVRQLQGELNKHGYQLNEDGIFGKKTRSAVRDYQRKNNLRLDGIAGDETWGSLMAPAPAEPEAPPAPVAKPSARTARELERLEKGYTPSADVTAALTGGYASSYAAAAGQQAYERYMQELMAMLPEFQEQAQKTYDREGQALREQYDLLDRQEKQQYDRWQDDLSAWERQYAQAQAQYDSAGQQDRKLYETALAHYRSMAQQEQKLSASGAEVDRGETTVSGGESLSSTAADSLYRAMGNYLKRGKTQEAAALLEQYSDRMTPAQRKRFEKLFTSHGQPAAL